jgi:hypothetical protein
MAVGVSSSQSLLVQVGTRYRGQDLDRASSLGRCLVAPGIDLPYAPGSPALGNLGPGME